MLNDWDDTEDESVTQQDVVAKEAHRYPKCNRMPMIRFGVNVIATSRSENELSVRDALNRSDPEKWRSAMNKELEALKNLKCLEKAECPKNVKVLHNKFVVSLK